MSDKEVKVAVSGRLIGGGIFEKRNKGEVTDDDDPKGRYSACVVLDKGEEAKIDKIIANAIDNKWGDDRPGKIVQWGVRDGDDPEYEVSFGNKFINPKATRQPALVARVGGERMQITPDSTPTLYPGCYVKVAVSAYCMEGTKEFKPTVTLNLRGIAFLRDGERLGDSFDEDEFGEFESETDDVEDLLG